MNKQEVNKMMEQLESMDGIRNKARRYAESYSAYCVAGYPYNSAEQVARRTEQKQIVLESFQFNPVEMVYFIGEMTSYLKPELKNLSITEFGNRMITILRNASNDSDLITGNGKPLAIDK